MTMSRRAALAGLAIVPLAACVSQTQTTYFYALTPLPRDATAVADAGKRKGWIIVGPVSIADYLDRPQIVTRSGPGELQLAEFHHWVEALDTAFPRVLSEDLGVLLGTDKIAPVPAPRDVPVAYQIEVDVLRLDAATPGAVAIDAMWRIYGSGGDSLVTEGRSRIEQPLAEMPPEAGSGASAGKPYYEAAVRAMSDVTAGLARAIAEALDKTRAKAA